MIDGRFDCGRSPDSVGLLLARREEERVLVALALCPVYSFSLHMLVDVDWNLLPQELLLAAQLCLFVSKRVASVIDIAFTVLT